MMVYLEIHGLAAAMDPLQDADVNGDGTIDYEGEV